MDIEEPEFDHTNYPIVPGELCLRRNVRHMPVQRRSEGLNAMGQMKETKLFNDIVMLSEYEEDNPDDENAQVLIPRIIQHYSYLLWLNRAYIPLYPPQRGLRQLLPGRTINSFSDRKCSELFGFLKHHLHIFFNLLRMPLFSYVGLEGHQDKVLSETVFLMFLYRLKDRESLEKSVPTFRRDQATISKCIKFMTSFLCDNYQDKVLSCLSLYEDRLSIYKEAVMNKVKAVNDNVIIDKYNNVFGFIDGTHIPIVKPQPRRQNNVNMDLDAAFYNGFHKTHCVIYQGLCFLFFAMTRVFVL